MDAPAVISLPISTLENMTMELAWRFEDLEDQIWAIFDELKAIKAEFTNDVRQKPISAFDPLLTIGKY